jgi:hypothetical protein
MMIEDRLKELIFQAMGEVSMCWSEIPRGVFDSSKAIEIGDRLFNAIMEESNMEWKVRTEGDRHEIVHEPR